MICYIAGNFEAGNSVNLALTVVISQHLQGTVHRYRPDVIDFAMLPAKRLWRSKQFHY